MRRPLHLLSLLSVSSLGACVSLSASIEGHLPRPDFDVERAMLGEPDMFRRFRVPDHGEPLATSEVPLDELLVVVERGGHRIALLVRQLTYHHLAQGRLGGEPYAVSF